MCRGEIIVSVGGVHEGTYTIVYEMEFVVMLVDVFVFVVVIVVIRLVLRSTQVISSVALVVFKRH